MAKYGKKASQKVERAMHERKRGKLKSGRSGMKVTSRKQAIAIGPSEARRAGGKVPREILVAQEVVVFAQPQVVFVEEALTRREVNAIADYNRSIAFRTRRVPC